MRDYYEDGTAIPNMAVFAAGNVDEKDTLDWASQKFDNMAGKRNIKREAPKGRTPTTCSSRTILSTITWGWVPCLRPQ